MRIIVSSLLSFGFLFPSIALANGTDAVDGAGHWMMWGGPGMLSGWGYGTGLGWVGMLLFWVIIILAVVLVVRALSRQDQRVERGDALDILKKRYAKGEIEKEEFEQKKKDLQA